MFTYQHIKDLREDNDLTQSDIARHLHISQSQYSNYERGTREIPLYLTIRLANYYHVSFDYSVRLNNSSKPLLKKGTP